MLDPDQGLGSNLNASRVGQFAALPMAQKYDSNVQYVDRIASILLSKNLDKICAWDEVLVKNGCYVVSLPYLEHHSVKWAHHNINVACTRIGLNEERMMILLPK